VNDPTIKKHMEELEDLGRWLTMKKVGVVSNESKK
jgi:hypothetical protein